jgi:hypothetical protein
MYSHKRDTRFKEMHMIREDMVTFFFVAVVENKRGRWYPTPP